MGTAKKIADAVHGTVSLSRLESDVINTRAFQRLRGVKHLGLASLVFPGADYSRFSHGVGTMHVTGLILDSLRAQYPEVVSPEDVTLYRLSALLHDIGHYPFSHTFETALQDFVAGSVLKKKGEPANAPILGGQGVWMHEALGRQVLTIDEELHSVVDGAGISVETLSAVIERVEPPKFTNLVSSDLDADRTDYLMRTACHTGLPYGNVDLHYLASQVRLDNDQNICFTGKGMRAAEHLLLGRYFDYQQVSFHKTVAGLEKVLNSAVGILLRDEVLHCSRADLQAMISGGGWYSFDDNFIVACLRSHRPGLDGTDARIFDAVLERRPPKMVGDWEVLGGPEIKSTHALVKALLQSRLEEWTERFGVPFWLWDKGGVRLTKIGSHVPVSETVSDSHENDAYDQAVRILGADGESSPLQESARSLMSVLSNYGLYSVRVYALVGADQETMRSEIEGAVAEVLRIAS